MRKSTWLLCIALLVTVLAAACTKQALQTTFDKQTTIIEKFLETLVSKDTTARLTENGGSYRLILHDTLPAGRDSLLDGGSVSLYYACYTLTSTSISAANLVATNLKALAASASWNITDTTVFKLDTLRLDKSLVEGLRLGLHGVQPKDEGYILFNGKYGFGNNEYGMIPAKSALVYQIWIENVFYE